MSIRKNKDFIPTDRWNVVETTGTPLMKITGTVAMTVGADTVTLTVPKGERWLIYEVYMLNTSGQTIETKITVNDRDGAVIGYGAYSSATGTTISNHYPNNVAALGNSPFAPKILLEGQKLVLTWGALAGKAGTSTYYIMGLQFNVGQGA